MTRFYRAIGTTLGVATIAWTISASAQEMRPRPPLEVASPPAPPSQGHAFALAYPLVPPHGPMPFGPPFLPPKPIVMTPKGGPNIFGPAPFSAPQEPALGPPFADMCLDMVARKSAFWAYLRVRLNLTAEQLAIWQELEAALGENERDEREECTQAPSQPEQAGFVQRIEMIQSRLASDLRHLRRLDAPIHKLATMLSPEQRPVLDRLPPMPR